jgi:hypothetical protein
LKVDRLISNSGEVRSESLSGRHGDADPEARLEPASEHRDIPTRSLPLTRRTLPASSSAAQWQHLTAPMCRFNVQPHGGPDDHRHGKAPSGAPGVHSGQRPRIKSRMRTVLGAGSCSQTNAAAPQPSGNGRGPAPDKGETGESLRPEVDRQYGTYCARTRGPGAFNH